MTHEEEQFVRACSELQEAVRDKTMIIVGATWHGQVLLLLSQMAAATSLIIVLMGR